MDPLVRLKMVQSLPITGARAVAAFSLDGKQHLAIPQLAADVPGQASGVNAGRSDQPVIVYRWCGDTFEERFRLTSTGGEDVEAFRIDGQLYLAIINLRSGSGPYDLNVESELLRWTGDRFITHQRFATFAAKQWRHFVVGDRHFLALAQGVEEPGAIPRNPDESTIYEWTGERFEPFQEVPRAGATTDTTSVSPAWTCSATSTTRPRHDCCAGQAAGLRTSRNWTVRGAAHCVPSGRRR